MEVRKLAIVIAVTVASLGLTGCQIKVTTSPAAGAAVPPVAGLPAAPGTIATPVPTPVPTGGQGAPAPLPSPIGVTPGVSSPTPPTVALPPPEDSVARIARLVSTYGIKRIYGSKATNALLDIIEDSLRRFPVGSLRDLTICCEPSDADPTEVSNTNVNAYWQLSSADKVKIDGGTMYLFRETILLHTVIHESSHHLTIYADRPYGLAVIGSLGYKIDKETNDSDAELRKIYGTWNAAAVPETSYNREYAKSGGALEHIAEMNMIHLGGDDVKMQITNTSFAFPAATVQVLQNKLGAAKKLTGGA